MYKFGSSSEKDTFERELETLRRVLLEKEMNEKMSTEGKDKLQSEVIKGCGSLFNIDTPTFKVQ